MLADPDETYNDGRAFKVTCRTAAGVIVTLIADNYYGYCKKEVKTQISFAANLFGNVEEEHAGGALAFASYNLGDEFDADSHAADDRTTFADVVRDDYGHRSTSSPRATPSTRRFPDLVYVPERRPASSVPTQKVWWTQDGHERSIPLLPGQDLHDPVGLQGPPGEAPRRRELAAGRDGGRGARSATSRAPSAAAARARSPSRSRDYMIYGPIFVADVEKDFDLVEQIFDRDYSDRWKPGAASRDYAAPPQPPDPEPRAVARQRDQAAHPVADDYTDEYNAWLASIPNYIYPIVFIIKRFYKPEWGERLARALRRGQRSTASPATS